MCWSWSWSWCEWGQRAEAGGTTQQRRQAEDQGEAGSSSNSKHSDGALCLCPVQQPKEAVTMGTALVLWLGLWLGRPGVWRW